MMKSILLAGMLLGLYSTTCAEEEFRTAVFDNGNTIDWRPLNMDGNNINHLWVSGGFKWVGGDIYGLRAAWFQNDLFYMSASYGTAPAAEATIFLFNNDVADTAAIPIQAEKGYSSTRYDVTTLFMVKCPKIISISHGPHVGFSYRKYLSILEEGAQYETNRFPELAIGYSYVRSLHGDWQIKRGEKLDRTRRTNITQYYLDATIPVGKAEQYADSNDVDGDYVSYRKKAAPVGAQVGASYTLATSHFYMSADVGLAWNVANTWNTIWGMYLGVTF